MTRLAPNFKTAMSFGRDCRMITRRQFLGRSAIGMVCLTRRGTTQIAQAKPPVVDDEVKRFMDKYQVPGLSLCFLRRKSLLYSSSFGLADRSSGSPVTTRSLFRMASNSKAITSAAIFTLIEAGRLKLADRIFSPYGILSEYADRGRPPEWIHAITVYHLLTHTCGGWNKTASDPMLNRPEFNHAQLIRWTLDTQELQHRPGRHYDYSNFGYCLLGRVIERTSGLSYEDYVRRHILDSIGITDMKIATLNPAPFEVIYYPQGGEQPYDIDVTRMDSNGGWIATPEDMGRFISELFASRDGSGLLTPASLSIMTTGTDANPNYGCGLGIDKHDNCMHVGELPGLMSFMFHTSSEYSWFAVMNTRKSNSCQAQDLQAMLERVARSVPDWRVFSYPIEGVSGSCAEMG